MIFNNYFCTWASLFCCFAKMSDSSNKKKRLLDFGYKFDSEGQLREVDDDGNTTEEGFKFDVHEKRADNQRRYEEIGLIMDREVYDLLETQGGLERLEVGSGEPKSFIFCSPEIRTKEKIVILIHGSGVVRAGQWARRLIINEDLSKGTMLPYIKHIHSRGWGVIVTNGNHNKDDESDNEIPGSETPEQHAATVWSELVTGCQAERILIIAHSYGGVVTQSLASHPGLGPQVRARVAAVLFTDSVHYGAAKWLGSVARNYVTSDEPVGTPLDRGRGDVPQYSAGHTKHEWTSWAAMDMIFADMDLAMERDKKQGNGAAENISKKEEL